ncbi:MAG: hypothetical protein FD133_204 [Erysipelotrichaceae bacterium]|nr:MAG: hypothetical protein FD179_804 [Erysipelotrichaceae bacterium]TXT19726.1 MAG: hypothetical protein FD133_204 [Erysipelotrichaceae bacterium]
MTINENDRKKNTKSVFFVFLLAEEAGFEPARALRLLAVFETAPFNHLGIPP